MAHAVSDGAVHKTSQKLRLSGRAFAVFGVTFSFVVMMISGVLLYVAPKGRIAQMIDWDLLWLSREGWEGLHIAVSLLFSIFVLWHFLLHMRVFEVLISGTPIHPKGHRTEAWIALAALLFVGAAALIAWPPSSWLIDGNEFFKQVYWDPAGGTEHMDH